MQKRIHIWLDLVGYVDDPDNLCTTYMDTIEALNKDIAIVHTTQTHFCSFRYGRRVFVHVNGTEHEITIGECEGTNKEIREAHNIEKMLLAGTFDWF